MSSGRFIIEGRWVDAMFAVVWWSCRQGSWTWRRRFICMEGGMRMENGDGRRRKEMSCDSYPGLFVPFRLLSAS